MSHSFYIHDVGNASLRKTLDAIPFDNLVVDAEHGDEGWPQLAHVFQDNVSVRSIETAMDDSTLQVRIMANSSPDDFRLASAIVEQVAGAFDKPVEPEDNEAMPLQRFREEYGAKWQESQAKTYLQMLVGMYRDGAAEGGVLRMWGTRREFHAGPRVMEPLLRDPENFSKNFFDRFRRLNYLDRQDVYVANLMAASEKGTGRQAVFSVLGQDVPTALSSQAKFVVMNHRGPDGGDEDAGQTIIPFDDFAEIAAESLTWLGDSMAVTPAYSPEAWQALLASASSHAIGFFDRPDLLENSADAEDDHGADSIGPHGIAEAHWEILAHAPLAVFMVVAGADGEVDKKEIAAFQKKLVEGVVGASDSAIMQLALVRASSDLEQRLGNLSQQKPDDLARLIASSRQVVSAGAGADEAAAYATALYAIGEAVASASGGGLFGFGSKIGKEERAVLDGIRTLLQLDGAGVSGG